MIPRAWLFMYIGHSRFPVLVGGRVKQIFARTSETLDFKIFWGNIVPTEHPRPEIESVLFCATYAN